MEGSKRKLIVLLCMHRSGSSLTANLLQRLGMSLGPFELLGAAPSNPHGHFEAVPFYLINRKVQEWAFGFPDEAPWDPAVRDRFVETRGAWPSDRAIPDEWIDEAEQLVRTLVDSGPVTGFKDPRTPLTRPFWNRVFERLDDIEVVGVNLLRSPHEIAMSLCMRANGNLPYWTALDIVGVHMDRMKAAADEGAVGHVVRFGVEPYWDDMKALVEACGLTWDEETARQVYDPSCVHHKPAAVPHPSQDVLNELGSDAWAEFDPIQNAARLAADARKSESVLHGRIVYIQGEWEKAAAVARQFHESEARAANLQRELDETRRTVAEVEKGYQITSTCMEQSEKHLARVSESLVSNQERRVEAEQRRDRAEQLLAHTEGLLAHAQGQLAHAENLLAEANERQARMAADFERLHAAIQADHAREAQLLEALAVKEQMLDRSREREERRWMDCVALKAKLDKFESNAIIGAAVRGRRQIRRFWLKLRHLGPNGEQRSSRVDRPL
ncbi:hypothetical protein [Paludisphaera sp.]|uniref:hypothetical protein n=1 Tax=Paludisphaera sp. TaxID=2017432 RepID=UPI00301C86C3